MGASSVSMTFETLAVPLSDAGPPALRRPFFLLPVDFSLPALDMPPPPGDEPSFGKLVGLSGGRMPPFEPDRGVGPSLSDWPTTPRGGGGGVSRPGSLLPHSEPFLSCMPPAPTPSKPIGELAPDELGRGFATPFGPRTSDDGTDPSRLSARRGSTVKGGGGGVAIAKVVGRALL